MGQVAVAFKMPKYTVQVKIAEDLSKPVESVDPSGDTQPGKPVEEQASQSIIKKEEIHRIIDDKRKTVEKLSVEETSDGKQKIMILVAPAPILRQQPPQQAAPAPAPAAAPAPAVASPGVSMPKPEMAPASRAASTLPSTFRKAMGF